MNGKSQKVYTNKEVLENERGSPQKYIKNKEVLENERGCPQCKKKKQGSPWKSSCWKFDKNGKSQKVYTNKEVLENVLM